MCVRAKIQGIPEPVVWGTRALHPWIPVVFVMSVVAVISSGSAKGVFWKRGLFRKTHFLEILESPRLENKGESDHLLEILENLDSLEIPEIPPVKRPFS